MANQEHVAVVRQGSEAISTWRKQHPDQWLKLDTADLSGADLSGADLSRADLSRADLFAANLSGAILSGAILRGAILRYTDFTGAILRDTDLTGAILYVAYLSRADLSGADLSGADLSGADLREANLFGANLAGVDLVGALLTGAVLSKVQGAHQAYGLEWTRLPPVAHESARTDVDPPWLDMTVSHFPTDNTYDTSDFETCIRPWPERWLDWERLRIVGRLPLFGASYTALILIPIIFYGLALYNDQVEFVRAWAEQIMAQPDHILHRLASLILARFQPRPIPQQSLLLLVSTILLAMGSTLYTFFCPSRIKEFSRDQWCDQLGRSLLHYWPVAWKHRYIRLACAACYALGGLGAGYVLMTKVCRVLLFILKYSPYPWPWR